jgi:hypothetical protein
VFQRLSEAESSTMAKGIFGWAEAESRAALSGLGVSGELQGSLLTSVTEAASADR